jgi:hypothetical protein
VRYRALQVSKATRLGKATANRESLDFSRNCFSADVSNFLHPFHSLSLALCVDVVNADYHA